MKYDFESAHREMRSVGLKTGSWSNTVVVAEALRRGIEVSSAQNGTRVLLRHGGVKHFWRWGHSDLNTQLAVKCVQQKEVASRILRGTGIHAPENAVFSADDVDRAWNWAASISPVVLKPHNALQGNDVFTGLDSQRDFEVAFASVSRNSRSVLVERMHHGEERRCFVLDNRFVAALHRRPASVLGNGTSTIQELVELKNIDRGRIHKPIELGHAESIRLARQGLSFESVPSAGERIYLRGILNIHAGGDAIDTTDELTESERNFVEQAAKAFPGLRLAGMDVLFPRHDEGASPTIIEINHNPMLSMHHFPWRGEARDVASGILDIMFPSNRP